MTYSKKIWVSGETINTYELNNLENGVESAHTQISNLQDIINSPETTYENIFTDVSLSVFGGATPSQTSDTTVCVSPEGNNAEYVTVTVNNKGSSVDMTAKVFCNYVDGGSFDTVPAGVCNLASGEQTSLSINPNFYGLKVSLMNNDASNATTVDVSCTITWW